MSLDFRLLDRGKYGTYGLFDRNITHNLNVMAEAAGIYRHLWRPDEIGITRAGDLVEPLEAGLNVLLLDPAKFKAISLSSGRGSYEYEYLCGFVRSVIAACQKYPDAEVDVCR